MNFSIRTSLFFALTFCSLIAEAQRDPESTVPAMPTNATTPVCGDDEELFQLRMIVEERSSSQVALATYRVITESTNEFHGECIACNNYYPGADVKLCLPRDGCHTALISRYSPRWISCLEGGGQELVVTWGDQTLRKNNGWFFDRIDFGDGCQSDPICDSDDEILFEFFRDRGIFNDEISWTLTDMINGENQPALLEGQTQDQNTSFLYETACVPRSSCLQFNMWRSPVPHWYSIDPSRYSIRLDGVIYSEGKVNLISEDKLGEYEGTRFSLNKTIVLGMNCTVDTVCNATDEDLFAMEFEVFAPDDYFHYCDFFESTSAIREYDNEFFLREQSETSPSNYKVWAYDYEGFEVNQTYAFITCIQKDECAKFSMGTDNPVTYKLFQNGKELTQRIVHTDGHDEGYTTTNAGACAGSSAGAGKLSLVPGLAVASTLAVLALFVTSLF